MNGRLQDRGQGPGRDLGRGHGLVQVRGRLHCVRGPGPDRRRGGVRDRGQHGSRSQYIFLSRILGM